MKRIISIIMLVASAHAVDVVLGKLSELSWTGTDINKVATWGSTGGFETYSTLTEERILRFDDYADTAVWTHVGDQLPGIGGLFLKKGTNHYHRTGWSFISCRNGTVVYKIQNAQYVPPLTPTNFAANLRNDLNAHLESPVFTNGIGTIYFEAINSDSAKPTRINVFIATNMTSEATGPINLLLDAETNGFTYVWQSLGEEVYDATTTFGFTRYIKNLNIRVQTKLRIQRWGDSETYGGVSYLDPDNPNLDIAFTVIDNIRVSLPPGAYRYQSPDYTGLGYEYPVETP